MAKKKKDKKGAYGEGHFTELPNGMLAFDFHYKDLDDVNRKKQVRGIDKPECWAKRDRFLKELDALKGGKNFDVTIPEICTAIQDIKKRKNKISDAAYSRNISTIKLIEKSSIGTIPIREISDSQLSYFIDGLANKYRQSTIDKVYRQLLLAYSDALNNKILNENPFNNPNNFRLEKPISKLKTKKVKALSVSEQKELINILQNSKMKYMNVLLLSLFSGARIGEILCLNISDISLEKRVIKINKTISRGLDYKIEIKETPKTENGEREVPIFEQLVPILENCIKNARKDGALFRTETGELVSTAMVTDAYKGLAKKYNLPYTGGHSLRHTFITNCCNAGVPLQVLAKWVGHSDIAFMLKTYYDLLKEQEDLEKNKVQSYFNNNGIK